MAASYTEGRAGSVEALLSRLSFHLGGAQLGITISSLVLGIVAEGTIGSLLGNIGGPLAEGTALLSIAAIAVAAVTQMTFGELIPKNLAVSLPHKTSTYLAPTLRLYGLLAAPVVLLFNGIANQVVRAMGLRPTEELRVVRTHEELEQVLRSASASTLDDESARFLGRSLRLAGKVAADALLPRTSMNTLPVDASVADLSQAAAEKGHTRFLVTGADIDDIVGLVDVRDVFAVSASQPAPLGDIPITQIMKEALFVSEQLPLDRVLDEMVGSNNRLAAVIDEHGGTAGLLTREDIFEEVLGNLEDEYDQPAASPTASTAASQSAQPQAQPSSQTHVQRKLSGSLTLDEASEALEEMAEQAQPTQLAAQLGVSLPDGPYETLAGFVLSLLGNIPEPGESVSWEGWRFEVTALDKLRIAELLVAQISEAAGLGEAAQSSELAAEERS